MYIDKLKRYVNVVGFDEIGEAIIEDTITKVRALKFIELYRDYKDLLPVAKEVIQSYRKGQSIADNITPAIINHYNTGKQDEDLNREEDRIIGETELLSRRLPNYPFLYYVSPDDYTTFYLYFIKNKLTNTLVCLGKWGNPQDVELENAISDVAPKFYYDFKKEHIAFSRENTNYKKSIRQSLKEVVLNERLKSNYKITVQPVAVTCDISKPNLHYYKILTNYNPKKLEVYNQFLSQMHPEIAKSFCTFIGSIFNEEETGKQILWLYGKGDTGKSVIMSAVINYIRDKLGIGSVVGIPEKAYRNNFFLSNFVNARVGVASDTREINLLKSSDIKQLTGKDSVVVEKKYETATTKLLYAKIIAVSNYKPNVDINRTEQRSRLLFIPIEFAPTKNIDYSYYTYEQLVNENISHFIKYCLSIYLEHSKEMTQINKNISSPYGDKVLATSCTDETVEQIIFIYSNYVRVTKNCIATLTLKAFIDKLIRDDSSIDSYSKSYFYKGFEDYIIDLAPHSIVILGGMKYVTNLELVHSTIDVPLGEMKLAITPPTPLKSVKTNKFEDDGELLDLTTMLGEIQDD